MAWKVPLQETENMIGKFFYGVKLMMRLQRIVILLLAICVCIVGGCKMQNNSINLDGIYKEFKNAETSRQRTDIFLKFSKSREKSMDFLLKKLELEQDDSVKADIISNILIIADRDTAENILPYMSDSNCRVRHFTLSTLVALGYNNIIDLLKKTALNDDCKPVRAMAMWSFGDVGDKSVIPFLENYREKSNDEEIKKAIDLALEKLKKEE